MEHYSNDIIRKGMKASDIDIYKTIIGPAVNFRDGYFPLVLENQIVILCMVNKVRKAELEAFEWRTKKIGYITDENGIISIITTFMNGWYAETTPYMYPDWLENIENINYISYVLLDPAKDKIFSIKRVEIPESVKDKLHEQWRLQIDNGITFEQHSKSSRGMLYKNEPQENARLAKDTQAAKEIKANIIISISCTYTDETIKRAKEINKE